LIDIIKTLSSLTTGCSISPVVACDGAS